MRILQTCLLAVALCPIPQAAAQNAELLADVAMAGAETREDDLPVIAAAPDGSLWFVWMCYSDRRDEIAVRRRVNGVWGNLQYVPNTSGDVWLPQAGVDGAGRLWVVWSQMQDGNWDIYARSYDPSEEAWGRMVRLTDHDLPDINPRLADDGKGRLALVWQGFRGKHANIYLKTYSAGNGWSPDVQITGRPANEWEPAAAFDSKGTIWVAYDSYKNGNYDVYLTGVRNGKITVPELAVAATGRFESRATVAVDAADRVWVAWEAGGANWGKDTGYNIRDRQPGVRLGDVREARIAAYANGRLQSPVEPLQNAFSAGEGKPKWTYQPHVFSDRGGNVLVAAKRLLRVTRQGAGTRGYWEYLLTRYEGGKWREAQPFPHSFGRSSTRIDAGERRRRQHLVRLADRQPHDGLRAPPDSGRSVGRPARTARRSPGAGTDGFRQRGSRSQSLAPERSGRPRRHPRLRRTTVHGRPVLQIVRGDFHRHTELSWDGGGGYDGSLQDFYRYMIDARGHGFRGVHRSPGRRSTTTGGGTRRR